jgi:NAD(P)-dependent dehydrogenase (short-subunit alcohol dehydrogenase family)
VSGARVLVTGATKGIGRAIAAALVERGDEVVGTARRPDECGDRLPNVEHIPLDLLDEASIDACLAKAGSVDILINNAGGSSAWPAAEADERDLRHFFQLDFFGPVRLIRGVLPGMLERGSGFILNIGSLVWRFAVPFQSAYASSKAALAVYSWTLRNEVASRGIKVVTLDPQHIRTTIEPQTLPSSGSRFSASLEAWHLARREGMNKAQDAGVVAAKVVRILAKRRPAPFYSVGRGAAAQVLFGRFLPGSFVEKQVRRRFGL